MGWSKQDRIIEHDKLVAMLPSVAKKIMKKYPFVDSVDVGIREVSGKLTQEFAFRIHVSNKKPISQLQPDEVLPSEIRGVATDVHQLTPIDLISDSSRYVPLWGGTQIIGAGTGTLGCFVHIIGDDKVHILSNHHVLMGHDKSAGDIMGHPSSACDSNCCTCNNAAILVDGKVGVAAPPGGDPNVVDAAYARLLGQNAGDDINIAYTNKIIGIGPIFGSANAVAVPGNLVRKRGRTTGYTDGTITSVTRTINNLKYNKGTSHEYQATYTSNQMEITSNQPQMAKGGDSGSVIVNTLNQVVGLLFASNGNDKEDGTPGGPLGFANNISDVLSVAGWNLRVLSSGTLGAIPISGMQMDAIPAAQAGTFFEQMESKLSRSKNGNAFLDIVSQNKGEVLDLINDNREVKVAWHRYQGPSFIGHLVKNAREPQHAIPKDINGYSFHNLLIKMSDVLERHGSYQLAQSIENYSLSMFNFAEEYTGLDSVDSLIKKHEFCPKCGKMNKTTPYA